MGVTNFDVIAAQAFIGSQFPGKGNCYFVAPKTGSDAYNGKSPRKALKTLAAALSLATANQNDVIYLLSEGNAAADATDYQSATLAWNKDGVHLIGVNSGNHIAQRSRVAFISTYATASNLFTLSANNCLIANVSFYAGVASANPTGCMKVTGQRNMVMNCHIAGLGHATMDIAGGYSLKIEGGAENTFVGCTIGVDTVTLGAAVNAQLYFASAATRNKFKDCTFLTYTNHATNNQFIRAAAGSMDRFQVFEHCVFANAVASGSTGLTQAMTVVAGGSPSGGIILDKCQLVGGTDWNATDAGNVYGAVDSATANVIGLMVAVTR